MPKVVSQNSSLTEVLVQNQAGTKDEDAVTCRDAGIGAVKEAWRRSHASSPTSMYYYNTNTLLVAIVVLCVKIKQTGIGNDGEKCKGNRDAAGIKQQTSWRSLTSLHLVIGYFYKPVECVGSILPPP